MSAQMNIYDGVKTDPKLLVEAACAWIGEGYARPTGHWMRLVNLIDRAYNDGAQLIRRGDLFYLAQDQGFKISVCREFKFDNNLWSSLSRYLLMFRPKFARIIHPKTCDIDSVNFEQMWRRYVCSQTYFPARTWQEAVKLVRIGDVSAA